MKLHKGEKFEFLILTQNTQTKLDLAETDFTSTITLSKEPAYLLYERALVYLNKGKFDNALTDHNKTIQLDSKKGNSYAMPAAA
jgi:Flp pilus assembly protein TadD